MISLLQKAYCINKGRKTQKHYKSYSKVREADMLLPIVAIGGITIDDIPALMKTGINGVAMSGAIINADDPVEYTRKVIESLNENKPK